MGVAGLTTFIDNNGPKYLQPHKLHDCNIIIDGNSLARTIYKPMTGRAFGGNYDDYFRSVLEFFRSLEKCKINAFVIMDGGHEVCKMQKIKQRLQQKIKFVQYIKINVHPEDFRLWPLQLEETFIDAVKECNVPIMRCVFEADEEVAALGRKLNCPVISNDSDFYISNVDFIPLKTIIGRKFFKVQCETQRLDEKETTFYYYLDCQLFSKDNFRIKNNLVQDILPLFAAVVGNDYIQIRVSIRQGLLDNCDVESTDIAIGRSQEFIARVLCWLKDKTVETALEEIVSRAKEEEKNKLRSDIKAAISGYTNENCQAYRYFTEKGLLPIETENVSQEYKVEERFKQFPNWFLEKLYRCQLPNRFVDLLHLRFYINSPSIEKFRFTEANKIAFPILNYVYTLLHNNIKDEKPKPFTYFTRTIKGKISEVLSDQVKDKIQFVSSASDEQHFRAVFECKTSNLDVNLLFKAIEEIPKDLQLYFMAIVYWLQKSQYCDILHLRVLIVCLIVLRVIDKKISVIRDQKAFQDLYGGQIKKERENRKNSKGFDRKRTYGETFEAKSVPERVLHVSESECCLVMDNLIQHFKIKNISNQDYNKYSIIVLHSFTELQSVMLQFRGLNALLNTVYESPRMDCLYNGVFLYNLYDSLSKTKVGDLLADSHLMFDFYNFLMNWFRPFLPRNQKEA